MSRASSNPAPAEDSDEPAQLAPGLAEVRYSLPDLLAELKLERTTGSFAMERLNQMEIGKLFQNKQKRRGKSAK